MINSKAGRVVFSSGREVYANNGFVGINDKLQLSEGYDGDFYLGYKDKECEIVDSLTEEERNELADYMISLWERFRKEGNKEFFG